MKKINIEKNLLILLGLFLCSLSVAQPVDVRKTRITAGDTIELKTLQINPEQFPRVDVIFRAENQKKEPIWGLTSDDMTVIEEVDTCQIIRFELLSKEMPVNIALVTDHSGSMEVANAFYNAQCGIAKLLENLNLNLESHIVLVDGIIKTPDSKIPENAEVRIVRAISGG